MSSTSRIQLEAWLKILEVKGIVLDIGGGTQTLEGRVKSFNPKEYLIMDNNAEIDYHNKWNKPHISESIESIGSPEIAKYKDYFDQIFMIEVSEYLLNPILAVTNAYFMLKKGGKFYSSFHFLYPHHNPEGKDLLRYTRWGVEKLMKLAGFRDIKITPRLAENYCVLDLYSSERMRAIKHFNHQEIGYLVEVTK